MKILTLVSIVLLLIGTSTSFTLAQYTLRLGFGSCNRAELDQSHWSVIDQQHLDAWIWLGDIVYADSRTPKVIKRKYKELNKNASYKDFRLKNKIYGIWDDHDYGSNDGGNEFEIKNESRNLLFKFLNIPKSNVAWKRSGAYQSHVIKQSNKSVKMILLDVRYFRDKLLPHPSDYIRYIADSNATMLGEEQWAWLERELNNSQEDLIVIGSGIQVVPEEHGYEKWADYPSERRRLFDLLKKYSNKKMMLISGDRHMAETSAFAVDEHLFLYEITSSGLTHSWTKIGTEPNGYRIRDLHPVKNFGLLNIYENNDKLHVVAEIKSIDGSTLDQYEIYPQ